MKRRAPPRVVVSCEHASAHVPARYRRLFAGRQALLQSHRGYDIGALEIAESVAKALGAPLIAGQNTRLLIDLNRSMGHRAQFSEWTRVLPAQVKQRIARDHYQPYRERVERAVRERLARGDRVLHVSVHSFTPALNGHVRNADVGLLYDPRRAVERDFCTVAQRTLRTRASKLRVRRNYPYRGVSDGLIPSLRRALGDPHYIGFEIEVNQRLAQTPASLRQTARLLSDVLTLCVAAI